MANHRHDNPKRRDPKVKSVRKVLDGKPLEGGPNLNKLFKAIRKGKHGQPWIVKYTNTERFKFA